MDLQPVHRVALADVGLAHEVDEAATAVGELLQQLVGWKPEHGRELVRDLCGVLDQQGIGVDRRGVLRHRERVAVAVEDRAALGGHCHVLALLRQSTVPQRARLDRVEPERPHPYQAEGEKEEAEEKADAAVDQAHLLRARLRLWGWRGTGW